MILFISEKYYLFYPQTSLFMVAKQTFKLLPSDVKERKSEREIYYYFFRAFGPDGRRGDDLNLDSFFLLVPLKEFWSKLHALRL